MKRLPVSLAGLALIELTPHADDRGFFVERYNEEKFKAAGLPHYFFQDNHSRSLPGVIRGLHYQSAPEQGKLVSVFCGAIWDVVVDIRKASPTFGKWEAFELSADNHRLLWVPPGFAHGFCVIGDIPADVVYKVTAPWNGAGEGGIRFDDPDLAIGWPVKTPLLSARDRELPSFSEYQRNPAW
jgi:dTDP-4-dehydrorhamnose 3,5-epimerase